jgi:hypothetical protein
MVIYENIINKKKKTAHGEIQIQADNMSRWNVQIKGRGDTMTT